MRKLFFISAFLLLQAMWLYARTAENDILLRGLVIDAATGDSLACSLEFRSDDGRKIVVATDSASGRWNIKCRPGGLFHVVISGAGILNEEQPFAAPNFEPESDFVQIIRARRLAPGGELFKYDFFSYNSSQLPPKAKDDLSGIDNMLRRNPSLAIDIVVSANDSYSLPPMPEIKDKKKHGRKVVPAARPQYDTLAVKTLVDGRTAELARYIGLELVHAGRVNVVPDYALKSENIAARPAESIIRVALAKEQK